MTFLSPCASPPMNEQARKKTKLSHSAGSAKAVPWTATAARPVAATAPGINPPGKQQGAQRHPHGPDREHQPVGDVSPPEHVLDEEQLPNPDRRHEQKRAEGDHHRQREDSIPKQERDPVAGSWRALGVGQAAGIAPNPERQRRTGNGGEGRRVDEHRQIEPAGRVQEPPEDRAKPEAEIARGLDVAVRLLDPVLPASGGTSENSAG